MGIYMDIYMDIYTYIYAHTHLDTSCRVHVEYLLLSVHVDALHDSGECALGHAEVLDAPLLLEVERDETLVGAARVDQVRPQLVHHHASHRVANLHVEYAGGRIKYEM